MEYRTNNSEGLRGLTLNLRDATSTADGIRKIYLDSFILG